MLRWPNDFEHRLPGLGSRRDPVARFKVSRVALGDREKETRTDASRVILSHVLKPPLYLHHVWPRSNSMDAHVWRNVW